MSSPYDELPLGTDDFNFPTHIKDRQVAAANEVLRDAAQNGVSDPIVRDILPAHDLDATGETLWNEDDAEWNQSPDVDDYDAATGNASYDVYEIDSDGGRGQERSVAIYGLRAIDGALALIQVNFKSSDGKTFERAHVQQLLDTTFTDQGKDVVTFTSPIQFCVQETGTIEFIYDMDKLEGTKADGDRDEVAIELLGKTAEKRGRLVGSR